MYAKIYANEGCAQMLFLESDSMCDVSYKDRAGKYQDQVGVTLPVTGEVLLNQYGLMGDGGALPRAVSVALLHRFCRCF